MHLAIQTLKHIIMKKLIIALAAIAAVIGLASCEKDPSKAIIGTWEATTVEMTIEGMKMEMDIAEMGTNVSFTFRKDGTGVASFTEEGVSEDIELTYSATETMLTVTIQGDTESFPYSVDGTDMTITLDGEILEEPGMKVVLHFVKK